MKYSAILLATAAALVSGQCLTDIPSCAQPLIVKGVSSATSCAADDFTCQCTKENQAKVMGAITADVIKECGQEDAIGKVLPATGAFCEAINAGKKCESGGGDTTSSAAPQSSATETKKEKTTAAETSSTSAEAPHHTQNSKPYGTNTGVTAVPTTASSYPTATGAGNSTTTGGGPAPTAGAATLGSIGAVAMLALGALAAF